MTKTDVKLPTEEAKKEEPACPFAEAQEVKKRLKLFVYGPAGTGKTFLALHFPGVALADMEGGADHYATREGIEPFHVLRAGDFQQLEEAVRWLAFHEHDFRTLVIDPVTKAWQSLIDHWTQVFMRRDLRSKGHKGDYFDLQPGHWTTIKDDWRRFVRLLHLLDMNIVATAHQKPKYADGAFMQVIGETFDAERSFDHEFDTVIQTRKTDKGEYLTRCIKDRTGLLPEGEGFATSYEVFRELFGKRSLERKAKKSPHPISDEVRLAIGEILAGMKIEPQKVVARLRSRFNVTAVGDLNADQGALLLRELKAKKDGAS